MNEPMISIVAAIGKNRELGKDNKLLWHIPDDLKRFREITSGHPIVMGRKTFESIGRVLPGRANIVITRNQESRIKNQEELVYVSSLEEAFEKAKDAEGSDEIMVIGGGQIFTQALPITDRLYLTIVDAAFDADTFFPEYEDQFSKIIEKEERESDGFRYMFLTLEK